MATSGPISEIPHLTALIKTLTNPQLKDLLRNEGLPVSGVKASLQLRIISYLSFSQYFDQYSANFNRTRYADHYDPKDLERLANSEGNGARYDALRRMIYRIHTPGASSFPAAPTPSPQYFHHTLAYSPASQARTARFGGSMSPHSHTPGPLIFKESPFFTIVKSLTQVVECKVRESTRDTVELRVSLSASDAATMQTDPNLRVMVYCAADSGLKQYTKSDIAFPHQVELKANLDEVKANLRGLKNKPGTTQPADVTNYIRKKPDYPNNIAMTYALTQKRFFVVANLVRQSPVEELVARLTSRKTISKEQVVREMKSRAEDNDIVATSSIMSLKCPLSTLRIQVPCRSVVCTHNQCFDASSFLELQKQAPTWVCPICSKSTSFESLQIDQYVDDILKSTSSDVEQVVIEPDGLWSSPNETDGVKVGGVTPTTDDDDLIEITEPGLSAVKQEPMASSILLERTPAQSRETSTPSSMSRLSGKKRPPAPVIDLTGSDDDDDSSPQPPRKRLALNFAIRGDTHQASSPLQSRPYAPSY